jgi:alkanesulfonate monooxygenase SsuD/methylene tetrahydromethanopterin reductase-like flavin-dependent oxidoreductase (luciferase family)
MAAVGGAGLALPLNLALPVRGFVEVAARAEAAGYDRLWVAEAGNNDAFGLLRPRRTRCHPGRAGPRVTGPGWTCRCGRPSVIEHRARG